MRKHRNALWERAMEKGGDGGPPPQIVADLKLSARLHELELALPEHLAAKLNAYLAAADEREAQFAALIV